MLIASHHMACTRFRLVVSRLPSLVCQVHIARCVGCDSKGEQAFRMCVVVAGCGCGWYAHPCVMFCVSMVRGGQPVASCCVLWVFLMSWPCSTCK